MNGRNYIQKNIFTIMEQERGYTMHQQRIEKIKNTPSKINEPAKITRKYNLQFKRMRSASAQETMYVQNKMMQRKNDQFLERLITIANRTENQIIPKEKEQDYLYPRQVPPPKPNQQVVQENSNKNSTIQNTSTSFYRQREIKLQQLDYDNKLMVDRLLRQKPSYPKSRYDDTYKIHQKDVFRLSKMARPFDTHFIEDVLNIKSSRISSICKPNGSRAGLGSGRLPPMSQSLPMRNPDDPIQKSYQNISTKREGEESANQSKQRYVHVKDVWENQQTFGNINSSLQGINNNNNNNSNMTSQKETSTQKSEFKVQAQQSVQNKQPNDNIENSAVDNENHEIIQNNNNNENVQQLEEQSNLKNNDNQNEDQQEGLIKQEQMLDKFQQSEQKQNLQQEENEQLDPIPVDANDIV